MTDEKELGTALKDGQDRIEIEGDLAKKVFKIKATGKVAWGVCISALSIAVVTVAATIATAGAAAPVAAGTYAVTAPVLIPAVSTLGLGTTVSAILIAVSAGGVGALNKLRGYKLQKISDTHVILTK